MSENIKIDPHLTTSPLVGTDGTKTATPPKIIPVSTPRTTTAVEQVPSNPPAPKEK